MSACNVRDFVRTHAFLSRTGSSPIVDRCKCPCDRCLRDKHCHHDARTEPAEHAEHAGTP